MQESCLEVSGEAGSWRECDFKQKQENYSGGRIDLPSSRQRKDVSCCWLTLILLTWRIWWVPNNVNRWQMGFNSAFEGLKSLSRHAPAIPLTSKQTAYSASVPLRLVRSKYGQNCCILKHSALEVQIRNHHEYKKE